MTNARLETRSRARQALWLWFVFLCAALLLNVAVPLIAGIDLHEWTYSSAKDALFGVVIYGVLFTVAPMIVTKDRAIVRRAGFWLPLALAVAAPGFRPVYRPLVLVTLLVLVYLHLRYDLSGFGVRAPVQRQDVVAIVLLGVLPLSLRALSAQPWTWQPREALGAGLDRLLLNPASTTENLFYFGFLTERLGSGNGRWRTPLLVGAMYTAHEMSNPEYWYEGMSFPVVFVGVAITAVVYLWCRSTVAIWLSSGLSRFLAVLI